MLLLLLSVDITCYYGGFHADLNETLFVGKVDEESKKLVQTAYDSLMAAVNEGLFCFEGLFFYRRFLHQEHSNNI